MVVMLNLLIAIIGEKYGTIGLEKNASCFKERAAGIAYLQFLIPVLPSFMTRINFDKGD
jgi:hypothetical protein